MYDSLSLIAVRLSSRSPLTDRTFRVLDNVRISLERVRSHQFRVDEDLVSELKEVVRSLTEAVVLSRVSIDVPEDGLNVLMDKVERYEGIMNAQEDGDATPPYFHLLNQCELWLKALRFNLLYLSRKVSTLEGVELLTLHKRVDLLYQRSLTYIGYVRSVDGFPALQALKEDTEECLASFLSQVQSLQEGLRSQKVIVSIDQRVLEAMLREGAFAIESVKGSPGLAN